MLEAPHWEREVRSYESEHVNGLWHADFHHGSLAVVSAQGKWLRPLAFAVIDDRSRLACHVQWYRSESARTFVHGLSQAFQKRALPRSLMTDNGMAMLAAESREGLLRLGVLQETTLPYSPYQNAKCEIFWAQLEGRFLAMMEGRREVTLIELNQATQAWWELEYNRKLHTELGTTPLKRYLEGPDVGRNSPGSDALRLAFTTEEERTQRRSDGTISLEGQRFEVPSRLRHLPRIVVRFARWDLARVYAIDRRTDQILERLYPLNKTQNADGRRRSLLPPSEPSPSEPNTPSGAAAPLLKRLLADYAATGLPAGYTPLDELNPLGEEEEEEK